MPRSVEKIAYEQPLNELSRVCLRLEFLLGLADHYYQDLSLPGSFACINTIIDLLIVLERPDLRNRLAKELHRYLTNLQKIAQAPTVNQKRLRETIDKIQGILKPLHSKNGRFAQSLRDNDFLTGIRMHIGTPGGISHFDMPSYYWWLEQPPEGRQVILKNWLSEFHEIRTILNIFLGLTRDSCEPVVKLAHRGFFQTPLDPQAPNQLLCVTLPLLDQRFPRISYGRYGISINFYDIHSDGHSTPTAEDVEFDLTICSF